MGVSREVPQIGGRGTPSHWDGGRADSVADMADHLCYRAKSGRSRSNGTSVICGYPPEKKIDSSRPAFRGHPRSLEPIGYLWLPISDP